MSLLYGLSLGFRNGRRIPPRRKYVNCTRRCCEIPKRRENPLRRRRLRNILVGQTVPEEVPS